MEYRALGEYCTITSAKRIFADQYVESGIPFFRSREIIEKKNNSDISGPLFIAPDVYENIKAKFGVPQKGDMLLTSVGTIGIPYVVGDEQFYFKDGNLTWMKNFSEDLSPHYLYYWISSKFGRDSLMNSCIGSSQAALTIEILKKYKLFIPSKHTQERIVSILSSYDHLIKLNNKRIKVLEQMAENLYKEWFVRFRFPGHETAEFENGIPKGWEVKRLGDYGRIETGKTPSMEVSEYYGDDYLFIKTPEMHGNVFVIDTEEKLSEQGHKTQPKKLLPVNSIMVTCIGSGGIVAINAKPCHTNQQINSIILDDSSNLEWLFFTCKSMKTTVEMFGATGSTMTNLSKGKFEKLKVIEPKQSLIESYHKICAPILAQIKDLMELTRCLIKQRDLLLPRLMSGKLEV